MQIKESVRRVVVWILTLQARLILKKYKPQVILVTGSVGKTSAKDAAYTALSATHFVRRSEKNYNGDIGVPLTVLGVPNGWGNPLQWLRNIADGFFLIITQAPYPAWLILEVGADRPGDISLLLSWLRPQVVIATRFPTVSVHVEFYDSPEAVQEEEMAPVSWLRPGGTLVANADDEFIAGTAAPEGAQRLTFGIHSMADLRATGLKALTRAGMPHGIAFDVKHEGEKAHIALEGVAGEAHVYAVLAGIGAALAIGVPLAQAAAAFGMHKTPAGRMRLIPGIKDSVLLDDSYNSSPVAVAEALKTLTSLPRKGKRIAVMGDMLELGSYSVQEHFEAGTLAAGSADLLVTVGVRARGYAEGAQKAGMLPENILQFDKSQDAAEHLLSVVAEGDLVLIKGSQGMRTERVTKALMANPKDAAKLLARQDAEWLTR